MEPRLEEILIPNYKSVFCFTNSRISVFVPRIEDFQEGLKDSFGFEHFMTTEEAEDAKKCRCP